MSFFCVWWWPDTPFAAIAVLLLIVPVVFAAILTMAYFGRWGRRATIVAPMIGLVRWLWLMLGLVVFVIGIAALVEGSERLSALVLLVAALILVLGAWSRMVVVVFWIKPWLVMLPILALVLGGLVLGFVGLARGDELFGPLGVLASVMLILLMFVFPWWRVQLGGTQRAHFGTGFPVLMVIMPIVVLIAGLILLVVHGLPRPGDDGQLDRGSDGSELVSETAKQPVSDTDADADADKDVADQEDDAQAEATTTTTGVSSPVTTDDEPEDVGPIPEDQTYALAMSDGRQFPIFWFVDGAEEWVGIVADRPESCWVLQYDAGDADVFGTCIAGFPEGGEPDPAEIMFVSDAKMIFRLRSVEQLVVTDLLTAQGIEMGLAEQNFTVINLAGDEVTIGSETFMR
ncbi:MAG: hypothetical protein GY925_02885 [Actinomycetia bacterium]|nr:hypothetical protein [Actinomycetes bacterium]